MSPRHTPRPNYFVALPLLHPTFRSMVAATQRAVASRAPAWNPCRMDLNKLHMTLFVFHMEPTPDNEARVQLCLRQCRDFIESCTTDMLCSADSRELIFNLPLQQFGRHVLYAAPNEDASPLMTCVRALRTHLELAFYEAGILAAPLEPNWSPHVTLFRTTPNGSVAFVPEAYEHIAVHMHVRPTTVEVLSMSAPPDTSGFYASCGAVAWNNDTTATLHRHASRNPPTDGAPNAPTK